MKTKKVSLIFPRFKYISGDPPLGIASLAAKLKAMDNVEVSVIDPTYHRSMVRVIDELKEINPDIIGIYSDTIMYPEAISIAEAMRRESRLLIAGGPHATIRPKDFTDYFDVVVVGEGEKALVKIVEDYPARIREEDKIINVWDENLVDDLNANPHPERQFFDMESYISNWNYLDSIDIKRRGTTMIASRGCPYKCTYCQPTLNKLFGCKLRLQDADYIVDEIVSLNKAYGVNAIFFHDDTLTIDHQWVAEFCEKLKTKKLDLLWGCNSRANTLSKDILKKMHDAGLRIIHLGIESGSQRILDEIYQKQINLAQVKEAVAMGNQAGIKMMGFFMIGAPTETAEEITQTINFARGLDLIEATFSIVSPLPETRLYDIVKENNYHLSNNYHDYDYYQRRAFEDPELPYNKLKRLQQQALISFYASPKRLPYILKHVTSIQGMKKLWNKIKRFM